MNEHQTIALLQQLEAGRMELRANTLAMLMTTGDTAVANLSELREAWHAADKSAMEAANRAPYFNRPEHVCFGAECPDKTVHGG